MAYIRCGGGGTKPLTRVSLLSNSSGITSGSLSDDYDNYQYIGVKFANNLSEPQYTKYFEVLMPASDFAKTASDYASGSEIERPQLMIGGYEMGCIYCNNVQLDTANSKRSIVANASSWKSTQFNSQSSIPNSAYVYVPVEIFGLK